MFSDFGARTVFWGYALSELSLLCALRSSESSGRAWRASVYAVYALLVLEVVINLPLFFSVLDNRIIQYSASCQNFIVMSNIF